MFLNSGNLTDTIMNVYADNYLNWLKAIEASKSMEVIHRYRGGMEATEKVLEAVIGPNIANQLISQKTAFIRENIKNL